MPTLVYQQDPIRKSLKALGAKWTLLILRDVGFLRLNRFGQIRQNNPGLTARVLSRRLRDMQREGLVQRNVKKTMVTYSLTPQGEDAIYILLALLRYGLKYHAPSGTAPRPLPNLQELLRVYLKSSKSSSS